MSLKLLGPLLVTTVVAIVGWYVVNYLNAKRDLRNTIIELRIRYLLEIYRRMERTMGQTVTREVADNVEIALADLQLLGTKEQATLAIEHVKRLGGKNLDELNLQNLLFDLRKSLREDLNLEPIEEQVSILRLQLAEENTQPTDQTAVVEVAQKEAQHEPYPLLSSDEMDRRQIDTTEKAVSITKGETYMDDLTNYIFQWINAKGVKGCPACGSQNLGMGGITSAAIHEVDAQGGIEVGSGRMMTIQLVCDNCLYVMPFAPGAAGITIHNPPK